MGTAARSTPPLHSCTLTLHNYKACSSKRVDSEPFQLHGHSFSLRVYPRGNGREHGLAAFLLWEGCVPCALVQEPTERSAAPSAKREQQGPTTAYSIEVTSKRMGRHFGTASSTSTFTSPGDGLGWTKVCSLHALMSALSDSDDVTVTLRITSVNPKPLELTDTTPLLPSASGSWSLGFCFDGEPSETFSDCCLRVAGSHAVFHCHRVVLAAASPVLRAAFSPGNWQEAQQRELTIHDADPGVVKLLLQYVYGLQVDVPLALLLELAVLADRYAVGTLAQDVPRWLMCMLLSDSALVALLPQARAPGLSNSMTWNLQTRLCDRVDAIVSRAELLGAWELEDVEAVMCFALPRQVHAAVKLALCWVELAPDERAPMWQQLLIGVGFSISCLKGEQNALDAFGSWEGVQRVPGLEQMLVAAGAVVAARGDVDCNGASIAPHAIRGGGSGWLNWVPFICCCLGLGSLAWFFDSAKLP